MPHREILKGKRILAVDDEPDILELVREALVESEVTTARSFEAAKQLINSKQFDLVILDIMGVDGFALLRECTIHNLPAGYAHGPCRNHSEHQSSDEIGCGLLSS